MTNVKSYLEENGIKAERTEENLFYTIEKAGEGASPKADDFVKVHYRGKLLSGEEFDASYNRNEPFTFQLGQSMVIQGWELALPLLKVGGKGTFYLPHELGYGAQGIPNVIPEFAGLIFEVELLDIMDQNDARREEEEARARQHKAVLEMMKEQMDEDTKIIDAYVAEKGLNVQKTGTGLTYEMIEPGTGKQAEAGKDVSVHYAGRLLDGREFDSSFKRNEPISFGLGQGQVIPGWDEGIALFKEGGKGRLIIPSPLAYGPRAMGPIPANSVLEFDIEVVKVNG